MLLSSIALFALFAASTAATLPTYGNGQIDWKDCPSFLNPNASSRLNCGYLDVPLDWDNPGQHRPVSIGFVRIPARDPKLNTARFPQWHAICQLQ